MSYLVDNCGMLRLLTHHSTPLTSGIYASIQVREAGDKLERFHEFRKDNSDVERTPDVEKAYILRSTMSKICADCTERALSFCQQNDNGFNSLYATAIYAACSQRERKLGTSLVVAEHEKSFPGAVRTGREKTAEKCVEAARRRICEFGIYDENDIISNYASELQHFREMMRNRLSMQQALEVLYKTVKPKNHGLLGHINADIRTLSDDILSDEDLRIVYVAMTDDAPVEAFESTLAEIEAWPSAVRAFREQLKRRRI